MKQFYQFFLGLTFLLTVALSACQKDQTGIKLTAKTDSLNTLISHDAGNYLATTGVLKITIQDTTYTFDAAKDSIAFVNVTISGQQYYGITAINKSHTLSFGISSYGSAQSGLPGVVAGSQFLQVNSDKTSRQYTLTSNVIPKDIGTIAIDQYKQDSVLAKGIFKTYLAKDDKPNSPFYKVEGSFNLKGLGR